MSQDAGNAKGKKPPRAKPQKGKTAERLKCSLLLTPENDLRLTVLATLRGMNRSTLVNAILDDSLRGVVVSLRGPLSAETGGAGEGAAETADSEARLRHHRCKSRHIKELRFPPQVSPSD